ncbi:hypothetical protein CSAL01_00558 [Colletotrichum salicis]|uniref:Uncharacterized protein n=1 Tax=Colletotrichum salicis TaxID=1209931 RepID=A0A135UPS5_9PEZI|nr:hypothetical protein CSAL01_00558 [Colletotrichum salicis]
MTGLLLSNQNFSKDIPIPTNVPPSNEMNTLLFLQSTCFQKGNDVDQLKFTLIDSVRNGTAATRTFLYSTPGNYTQGWNLYLVILAWYAIPILAELGRCCYRRKVRNRGDGQTNGIVRLLYGAYLVGGIGICGTALVILGNYKIKLRQWVKDSRWLERDEGGQSGEDDATSFGQLVTIILTGLTSFTFLSMLSGKSGGFLSNAFLKTKPSREMCARRRKPENGYLQVGQQRT